MYESEEPVRVSAGILKQGAKVLVCQRGMSHRYGLRWEFPGGKSFPGENPRECLVRELEEELGIVPTEFRELKTIHTDYPDGGKFLITFFLVSEYEGTLKNRVFEDIQWASLEEVESFDLLEGSRPILQHL
jgi:8-oxo-dGTP diphosphatase